MTLLRPPVVVPVKSFAYVSPMPPIGLAYVAGALRAAGHAVHVVDAPGEAPEQITDLTTSFGGLLRIGLTLDQVVDRIPPTTTVVGITNLFLHEWPTVRELAELVKRRRPDVFVVIGGENATGYRQWILEECAAVDCCVLGEGEATAVELVGRIAEGAPLTGMRGIARRGHEEDGAAELPVRIRALATIPRPAWDLFPMESYFRSQTAGGDDRGRSIPLLATRGCPYKCSFCSAPQMWTTRYTVRDPEDIVDEVEDYVERYGIASIDFVDLTAMTKHNWSLALCDALEARGLGTTWQLPIGTRSEGFDAHVLQRLHDAGCRSVTFAPEHGSQHMLEVYDKRVDLDHILESIRIARQVGMVTHVNTVIGHPAETWADRWRNLTFLVRTALVGCDTASAFTFHPYPGSRDFQEALDSGRLVADDAYIYDGLANGAPGNRSWNPNLSARSLHLSQLAMTATFGAVAMARDPRRVWRLGRAVFAKGAPGPADSTRPHDRPRPLGLRLGQEHDTRVVALWLRSRLRSRGKEGGGSTAPREEGPALPRARPDRAEAVNH